MKKSVSLVLIFLLTIAVFLWGLTVGAMDLYLRDIFSLLQLPQNSPEYIAMAELRIPRLITAFLVGAALSISGYIMQAMINNPLADPYILGTASGASLGANMVYAGIIPFSFLGILASPVFAFIGGFIITIAGIIISSEKGHLNPAKLLLAGVGLSSFMVSLVSLIIFFSNSESKLKSIIFWSLGGFERANWTFIPVLSVVVIASSVILFFMYKQITLLLLGEGGAYNLGLNIVKTRWVLLMIASLNTAVAVAVAGPVGFVGLFIPHIVRGLFGTSGKFNIPLTLWIGGLFMMFCDIFSRFIYPPAGIPVGIITAFVGIPFFVYLLLKRHYSFQ